jgi:hypothetical protein
VPLPEITERVPLTRPDGRLDRRAVGWARQPLVDTDAIGRGGAGGPRRFGRNKRWEYWGVTTPTHVLALTVSSIDYAAVHEVWVLDRESGRTWGAAATVVPARGVELPGTLGEGPARARALDHGRGRWPYDVRWNWGAGSGESHGRVVGIQVGGRWTVGTGSTENAVLVDGRLHHLPDELVWDYDLADPDRPWRVTGGGLDATFDSFHTKVTRTHLGIVSSSTDQCFGTWSGTFTPPDGGPSGSAATAPVRFDGLVGWAEEVHNRW